MQYMVKGYTPKALFEYFEEISAIPRGSGNEKAVSDYLVRFAQEHKLDCRRDSLNNVVIKKPASLGHEDAQPLILQGHTDMVCEKESGSGHDFLRDPIRLVKQGDFLCADSTTLGADNGIAVAMILDILSDSAVVHPPLECIFTSSEETGMFGAAGLDASWISARRMLNLDSEEEGIATVSCAGGMRIRLYHTLQWEENTAPAFQISIDGLLGGHSGCDIHLEHTNANKLMGRILYSLLERFEGITLGNLSGGTKDNAIPRQCTAIVCPASEGEYRAVLAAAQELTAVFKDEISAVEPNAVLTVTPIPCGRHISSKDTRDLINLIFLAPDGALRRNVAAGGFIIASVNMGILTIKEDGRFCAMFAPRSSVQSLQENTKAQLRLLADLTRFTFTCDSEYPGWAYREDSPLRDALCGAYKELFGSEMKLEAIHAGLECGLFSEKFPGLDAVAIGPNIAHCHTPQERLDLKSCERTAALLRHVLKKLAD